MEGSKGRGSHRALGFAERGQCAFLQALPLSPVLDPESKPWCSKEHSAPTHTCHHGQACAHLLCAGGLSHLNGEKDIPQHLLVSPQISLLSVISSAPRLALDAASPPWLQCRLPDQKLCPQHRLDQSWEQARFQLSVFLGKEENTHNAKGAYTQAIYLRNFVLDKLSDSHNPATETSRQLTPETAQPINRPSAKLSSALCSLGPPSSGGTQVG